MALSTNLGIHRDPTVWHFYNGTDLKVSVSCSSKELIGHVGSALKLLLDISPGMRIDHTWTADGEKGVGLNPGRWRIEVVCQGYPKKIIHFATDWGECFLLQFRVKNKSLCITKETQGGVLSDGRKNLKNKRRKKIDYQAS